MPNVEDHTIPHAVAEEEEDWRDRSSGGVGFLDAQAVLPLGFDVLFLREINFAFPQNIQQSGLRPYNLILLNVERNQSRLPGPIDETRCNCRPLVHLRDDEGPRIVFSEASLRLRPMRGGQKMSLLPFLDEVLEIGLVLGEVF